MEHDSVSVVSDREEGEIVDDDFEDISDNSIILPSFSGKSVSSKEHLPAISLSSVSEIDEPKAKHRKIHKRRTSKSLKRKKSSHRKIVCSDSDSDDVLDKKLQKQLKAAIRVENVESHKNSLRSRLRTMTKLNNDSDNSIEKVNEQQQSSNELIIDNKTGLEDVDNELVELRLEALKTAFLNKCRYRKKRKIKDTNLNNALSDVSVKTYSETNKENNIANGEEKHFTKNNGLVEAVVNETQKANDVVSDNISLDEDEDILRATLLASMARKITDNSQNNANLLGPVESKEKSQVAKNLNFVKTKEVLKKNDYLKLKSLTHLKVNANGKSIVLAKIPKVKPLIINVNDDSDSEEESPDKNQVQQQLESTVDKFLKEQRAKVEALSAPNPKTPENAAKKPSTVLEKSAVKLLSKAKQIEYQKLLLRLKNAEKKTKPSVRIRRLSGRVNEVKQTGITPKKFNKPKGSISDKQQMPLKNNQFNPQITNIKEGARVLHKTLKEMQISRNGRLQIQDRYKLLTPIMRTINTATIERKKYDLELKRLQEEVSEMKRKLNGSHESFISSVKKLLKEKALLDESYKNQQKKLKKGKSDLITTSTPAVNNTEENMECSNNLKDSLGKEEELIDATINPGDPNDIDRVYKKQENCYSKYVSPLDNKIRVETDDPFSIVCPYDVNGNCRDPDCNYKHLAK